MSPATIGYPPQDIKVSEIEQKPRARSVYQLLEDYKHFSWADKDYDLSRIIGEGAKLSAVVGSIDPKQKTGGALYHRLRRLLNALVTENLVTISGNWSYGDALERPGNGVQPSTKLITLTNRMQNSAHFAQTIPEGWFGVVDHYLGDDRLNAKSDPCRFCSRPAAWRDRAEVEKRTQPARCRTCTRKRIRNDRARAVAGRPACVIHGLRGSPAGVGLARSGSSGHGARFRAQAVHFGKTRPAAQTKRIVRTGFRYAAGQNAKRQLGGSAASMAGRGGITGCSFAGNYRMEKRLFNRPSRTGSILFKQILPGIVTMFPSG